VSIGITSTSQSASNRKERKEGVKQNNQRGKGVMGIMETGPDASISPSYIMQNQDPQIIFTILPETFHETSVSPQRNDVWASVNSDMIFLNIKIGSFFFSCCATWFRGCKNALLGFMA